MTTRILTLRKKKKQFDFSKKELPHRPRAGSSPIRNGPQVLITSPSATRNRTRRLRGGSHGDVDFNKNGVVSGDYDSVPGADEELLSSGINTEQEKVHSDIVNRLRSSPNSSLPRDNGFYSGDESDASSTMSFDFMPTADSKPDAIGNHLLSTRSRALSRADPTILHALPPPIRPVSMIQPVSLLSQMLRSKSSEGPLDAYRFFSGKGELKPVYLKIYIPFCEDSPFEVVLSRFSKNEDGGSKNTETSVAEAIGFVLHKYTDETKEPKLTDEQLDINRWVFRMVDEGEPDEDFPPLERTQSISSYMTMKTSRRLAAAANREAKLEGEFALCEASAEQYSENCRVTPNKATTPKASQSNPTQTAAIALPTPLPEPTPTLGPSARQVAADASVAITTSTPRSGPAKILRIYVSTIDEFAQSVSVCVTTDTYIAEVLEHVCRKKNLDKNNFVLRITGVSNVVAPLDRTVASLGDRAELDLVRRRFITATEGLGDRSGSPSTLESPNAPIIFGGSSSRTKKTKFLQPALWAPDMLSSRDYLKFTVWRKASMSFMSRHERVLAIDGEYVHIMPSESHGKTRSIHISTIIGCKTYRKAPSSFKILVMRPQKETKRYDFEAMSEEQAGEVVQALRKATMDYRMDYHNIGL